MKKLGGEGGQHFAPCPYRCPQVSTFKPVYRNRRGGGGLVRMWVLTQEAKGGARESAFLTHFQELLVVPVWGPLGTARP